jgi:hypothetical protein
MKEVILGLDVSTSKIGLSIIDYNNNLLICQVIKLNSNNSLIEKCIELENIIDNLNGNNYINNNNKLYIKEIFIESPFMMFSGGKTTAMTMSKLQRFNGMVSYMVRRTLGVEPVMIAANKARGLIGLKIKRGENTNGYRKNIQKTSL